MPIYVYSSNVISQPLQRQTEYDSEEKASNGAFLGFGWLQCEERQLRQARTCIKSRENELSDLLWFINISTSGIEATGLKRQTIVLLYSSKRHG